MDNVLGKMLEGRYLIEELIGVGGMANVYRGFDTAENRPVAIKMLRDEYAGNDESLRRFRNESKAIYSLNHPNIVKIYDVLLDRQNPVIIMEYVQGITLKEYIEKKKVVAPKVAAALAMQLMLALQHAHDNGIVHRDVKPQNIMLMSDGTVKITDFGIVRFSRSVSHTLTNRAIGSVHYISPEQARGEPADQKSDIYSVGVMLYEMLTGRLPFDADTPVSVAIKQIESQAVRPREINPNIPEGLEAITIRAMQKDPERRYQSAAEMLRDIDEFKKNPNISFEYRYLTREEPAKRSETAAPRRGKHSRRRKGEPQEEEMPQNDKIPIIPVFGGITAAFVLASAIFVGVMIYLNNPFATVADVPVPNLVGQSYEEVRFDPEYTEHFVIEVSETSYNAEYGEGVIYEQTPAYPMNVKEGSTIQVKVSSGAEVITLPSFAGQEATAVFQQLESMGLNYAESSIYSNTVQAGYVVRTDPGRNTQVNEGDTITVYVSRGTDKQMVEIPSVVGEDEDDAETILTNANLTVRVEREESRDVPRGEVIRQSPEEHSQLPEGSQVTIVVSSGRGSGTASVSLMVVLPDWDDEVTMTAEMDGDVIQEEDLVPSDEGVWRVSCEGEEGTAEVEIYLDGDLYQAYEVDFDEETRSLLEDNSGDF